MVQKYLTIFPTVNDSIEVADDRRTPAMRLDLVSRPLTYGEIL